MIVDTHIDGRPYRVIVPDDAIEYEWPKGVVVGPADLSPLGLPLEIENRLHDELFARRIITAADCAKKRGEIAAAIMAALTLDAERVYECYMGILVPPEPTPIGAKATSGKDAEVADNG